MPVITLIDKNQSIKNTFNDNNYIITVIMGRGGNNTNLMYGILPINDRHLDQRCLENYSQLISSVTNIEAIHRVNKQYAFNYYDKDKSVFEGHKFNPPEQMYNFLKNYSGTEDLFIRKSKIPLDYLTIQASEKIIPINEIKEFEYEGDLSELLSRISKLEDKSVMNNSSPFTLHHISDFNGDRAAHSQGQCFKIKPTDPAPNNYTLEGGHVTLGELVAVEDIFGSEGDWIYSGAIAYPGSVIYIIDQQPVAAATCGYYAEDYFEEN
jgi:hypothetical protein